MKKSMSWVDIRVWIEEQRDRLIDSIVDNLYLVNDVVILRLRCRDGTYKELVLEPGKRICFTKRRIRPSEAIPKQTQWRSLIRGCRIVDVKQLGVERVVIVELKCGAEARQLIVELLPRGVIAIIKDGKIALVTESRVMKDRVVKPGCNYVPPPLRKSIEEMSLDELKQQLLQGKDLVRGLIKGWGLPPEVAETVIHLMKLDPRMDPKLVDDGTIEKLREEVMRFVNSVSKNPQPCILIRGGEPEGFYPFVPPTRAEGAEVIKFDSFNDAIDEYFSILMAKSVELPPEVSREIEKLKRAVEKIMESVKCRKQELERVRALINEIESNYQLLEALHENVRIAIKRGGWSTVSDVVKRFGVKLSRVEPKKGTYVIKFESGTEVELDVRSSFIEIYSSLRKKLAELEKDIERSLEEAERLKREIEKLETEAKAKVEGEVAKLLRKVEWFERFHWTLTRNGFLALGGKDASQNIALIRRYLEPHDVVMHANIHGASAVVLKTGSKEVPEEDLLDAATLAACYSKAWKLGRKCVDVFWVKGDQVSLSAPPGEYLPKGSFMVYGKKNFIKCVELRLAIGIELVEGKYFRIFVGPEEVVSKRCLAYMVIEPGDKDPSSIAKEFLEKLGKANFKTVARSIDINELVTKIPGRSRMVKFLVREKREV